MNPIAVSVFFGVVVLAGAIFLLLQMDQPFGGIIRVSHAPLRIVLAQLAQ